MLNGFVLISQNNFNKKIFIEVMDYLTKLVFILFATFLIINAYQVGKNPFRRREILDPSFILEWEVDWTQTRVYFNTTVKTTGWIAFGLAKNANSFVGLGIFGVYPNGTFYHVDAHIPEGSTQFIVDHNDAVIESGWENGTWTSVNVSRPFDTCDPNDYLINTEKATIIWMYGKDDNYSDFTALARGASNTYLLDPEYSPKIEIDGDGAPILVDTDNYVKNWSVVVEQVNISQDRTRYLSNICRLPKLDKKHHLIGFAADYQNTPMTHILVFRCHAPSGSTLNATFASTNTCYFSQNATIQNLCSELLFIWNVGGTGYFFPPHVATVFNQNEDEFYQIQYNFDPVPSGPLQLNFRLDFFYTNQLRPHESGFYANIHAVPGLPESFMIPPEVKSHLIFTHCSPECTKRMLPEKGINVFALVLHTHNAGIAVKVRHFRNGEELPWILYDGNYDNRFQVIRNLKAEVKVLQSDQIIVECEYKTKNTSVGGGYALWQEMCSASFLHYEQVKGYSFCTSQINSEVDRFTYFGVRDITWEEYPLAWVVEKPARFANWTVNEVSDKFVRWTDQKKQELQEFRRNHPYIGSCKKDGYARINDNPIVDEAGLEDNANDYVAPVVYPSWAQPYQPPKRNCKT